jgi:hypothetical protein
MKKQHIDQPFTDFLAQVVKEDFECYHEEFRQEQLEIYRARLKKEKEQIKEPILL